MQRLCYSAVIAPLILAVMVSAARAQNNGGLNVDQLAGQIFHTADHNHNEVLSQVEFHAAQRLLSSEVSALARRGLIGRGPAIPAGLGNGLAVLNGPNLSHNHRITQPEFTLYARSVVQQADSMLRSMASMYPTRRPHHRSRYGNHWSRYLYHPWHAYTHRRHSGPLPQAIASMPQPASMLPTNPLANHRHPQHDMLAHLKPTVHHTPPLHPHAVAHHNAAHHAAAHHAAAHYAATHHNVAQHHAAHHTTPHHTAAHHATPAHHAGHRK